MWDKNSSFVTFDEFFDEFFLSGFVFVTQLLVDATDFSNWLLFGHLLSYPSSASVQLDHLTACGQFDMSYPYCY
mgnify:CR=1 FL=1